MRTEKSIVDDLITAQFDNQANPGDKKRVAKIFALLNELCFTRHCNEITSDSEHEAISCQYSCSKHK